MVCISCKGNPHSGQPNDCPGYGFCDCQHRPMPQNVLEEKEAGDFFEEDEPVEEVQKAFDEGDKGVTAKIDEFLDNPKTGTIRRRSRY